MAKMRGRTWDFPWMAVTVAASVVVIASLYLVSASTPGSVDDVAFRPGNRASVTLAPLHRDGSGGDETAAELTLHDPTPLFLPTEFNSGRADHGMTTERSPGASFPEIESKFVFPDEENQLDVPDVVQIHDRALDALEELAPPIVLTELPRGDIKLEKLPGRSAMIEVKRVSDGAVLWRQSIDPGALGVDSLVPVELMVVVDSAGFVTERGALNVAAGGGMVALFGGQQMDLGKASELLRKVGLGGRLSAGIYRISLGP